MKKNILLVLILGLSVLMISLIVIHVVENKMDNVNDKKITSTKIQEKKNKEDRKELFYVADFDKEESERIYNELSEEERQLQTNTSKHVGYKKLTSEQIDALKTINEQGLSGICEFQEMEAIGEANSDERLTVDDIDHIRSLSKEAKSWYEIIDGLEKKQKYPDYRGTVQTYAYDAYWLEGKLEGITLLISYYPTKSDDIGSGMKMELVMKEDEEPEVLINFNEKPLK